MNKAITLAQRLHVHSECSYIAITWTQRFHENNDYMNTAITRT